MILISDKFIIFGIRLIVSTITFIIIVLEILWDGVGTFLLYNLLTKCAITSAAKNGFSGLVLPAIGLSGIIVSVFTQAFVTWERRKLKHSFTVDVIKKVIIFWREHPVTSNDEIPTLTRKHRKRLGQISAFFDVTNVWIVSYGVHLLKRSLFFYLN